MDQRLIGPRVVEGRGHVHVTISQNEQRPLETGVTGTITHRDRAMHHGKKFDAVSFSFILHL